MGCIKPVLPVKLFCGILLANEKYKDDVFCKLEKVLGKIDRISDIYDFSRFTNYYSKEMGSHIKRIFVSFEDLILPDRLSDIKLITNNLEQEFKQRKKDFLRPVNLDPGIIANGRMILATTKDYSHRIYIGKGIYAEVTFLFRKNKIYPLEWTYPDYASGIYDKFFLEIKNIYHKKLKEIS